MLFNLCSTIGPDNWIAHYVGRVLFMEQAAVGIALIALIFVFDTQYKIKKLEKRVKEIENKSEQN